MAQQSEYETIVIDNFSARLTRFVNGDLNSGLASHLQTFGVDNFTVPRSLTWAQAPVSIEGSVVTDLVMAGKARVENGITYVYAIGHTGRLYKIQVNDPATHNPNFDTPVLLATLTAGGPTFNYGGSLDFYQGSGTEKIWIGTDQGITKINFDGSGETAVGTTDSTHWIANVPRRQIQFGGSIYITNSSNLAQVDSTETVVNYNKISPGFPLNTQARDIETTSDGRYVVIVVTRTPQGNVLSTAPDTNLSGGAESILVYWNGVDLAASSFTTMPFYIQTAYHSFGQNEYIFGSDIAGSTLSTPAQKILTVLFSTSPMANAVTSSGDFVGWVTAEEVYGTGHLYASLFLYGALDLEITTGWYRQVRVPSTLTNGDVIRIPFFTVASNSLYAGSSQGYTTPPFQNASTGKTYFSTLEYNGTTTQYKLYAFSNAENYLSLLGQGVYQTQTQLFGEKRQIKTVRIYNEPISVGVSFQVDLIGSNGSVISGSTKVFTVGTNASVGDDMLQYNPSMAPTYALGLRITNLGAGPWICHKVEIDHATGGK